MNKEEEQAAKKKEQHEKLLREVMDRVERDWPIRCKLAELAGFKANPKNERALFETEFDLSITDLFLQVCFRKPDNMAAAYDLIRNHYK